MFGRNAIPLTPLPREHGKGINTGVISYIGHLSTGPDADTDATVAEDDSDACF